jgi:predicted outer membrane repeat protein
MTVKDFDNIKKSKNELQKEMKKIITLENLFKNAIKFSRNYVNTNDNTLDTYKTFDIIKAYSIYPGYYKLILDLKYDKPFTYLKNMVYSYKFILSGGSSFKLYPFSINKTSIEFLYSEGTDAYIFLELEHVKREIKEIQIVEENNLDNFTNDDLIIVDQAGLPTLLQIYDSNRDFKNIYYFGNDNNLLTKFKNIKVINQLSLIDNNNNNNKVIFCSSLYLRYFLEKSFNKTNLNSLDLNCNQNTSLDLNEVRNFPQYMVLIGQNGKKLGEIVFNDENKFLTKKLYSPNGKLRMILNSEPNLKINEYKTKIYYENSNQVIFEGISTDKVNKGTFYLENGKKLFKGTQDESGKFNGKGEFFWSNGNIYEDGIFEDGLLSGIGSIYYETGTRFMKGSFKKGKLDGEGEIYDKNDILFKKGIFKNDKLNGKGELNYEKGKVIIRGNFIDDKLNGKGELNYEKGKVIIRGNFIDDKLNGKCKIVNQDTYTLQKSIKIQINGEVLLDGNNSTFDGSKSGNILNIIGNGEIIIKNLKFINATNSAIKSEVNLSIDKCEFENNTTLKLGGAIYCDKNIRSVSGKFYNNQANDGGAIYCYENIGSVTGEFYNNKAEKEGGAIKCQDNLESVSGKFYNNQATYGGAIYCEDDIAFIFATFEGNTAVDYGGAICCYQKIGSVSGKFYNNTATANDGCGGAIYSELEIKSVSGIFENNKADSGGAIHCGDNIGSISGSFINNSATYSGGAIDCDGNIGSISGSFINNSATNSGGAIDCDGNIGSISGSFINNTVEGSGGAIYCKNIESISGTFEGNTARNSGSAIYCDIIESISGTFKNNTAKIFGGAIECDNIGSINADSIFEGNEAESGGGIRCISIKSVSGIFNNNTAKDSGGAIYCVNIESIAIESISGTFKNNKAKFGGAICSKYIESINADARFEGNEAEKLGGAIYCQKSIASITGIFKNNTAKFGGAINCKNIESIKADARFEDNTAKLLGGAIYCEESIKSVSGTFNNNTSEYNGGAIYAEIIQEITSDATFINNNAKSIRKWYISLFINEKDKIIGRAIYGEVEINNGVFE